MSLETQETNVTSYITDTGKYVKRHLRGEPMKDKIAVGDLIANSSATSDALNKEDMPKAFHSQECADVFLNVKKDVQPIRGGLETSEDDTLMGRLAKRMASRDYIDSMNLGMGTKGQRAGKAALADDSGSSPGMEIAEGIPTKMNMGGPAVLKKGTEMEHEHDSTFKKVAEGKLKPEDAPREVAKDHIKELGPGYYHELPEMEAELKKKVNETSSTLQNEKGFGLHFNTSDISAFNASDPISSTNQKVMPGKNMAEQARIKGNVFESRTDI